MFLSANGDIKALNEELFWNERKCMQSYSCKLFDGFIGVDNLTQIYSWLLDIFLCSQEIMYIYKMFFEVSFL